MLKCCPLFHSRNSHMTCRHNKNWTFCKIISNKCGESFDRYLEPSGVDNFGLIMFGVAVWERIGLCQNVPNNNITSHIVRINIVTAIFPTLYMHRKLQVFCQSFQMEVVSIHGDYDNGNLRIRCKYLRHLENCRRTHSSTDC